MLTSMNLYEFSQATNFEAAFVIEKGKFLSGLINNSSHDAWEEALDFINKIIEKSETVFKKGDVYKTTFLGILEEKVGEKQEDNTNKFYKIISSKESPPEAFCIRTGVSIPFNIKKPYSDGAFKSWIRFSNDEYKEKYCHFTGEESYGETCYKSPIMKKNWRAAKIKFNF